jgi:hypothetical protein
MTCVSGLFSAVPVRCLAVIFLGVSVACVETYDGNGVPAEEDRQVSGFDRISARGSLGVRVTRASVPAVSVHIDQNLLRRVRTRVSNTTLVIQIEGGNLGESLPGPHVLVALPSLREAELNGSGRLEVEGFDEQSPISVEMSGAGEVSWSGISSDLEGILNGSGTLALSGDTQNLELHLAGSGKLDARDLLARRADLELSGAGEITATVDGRVDAKVSGTGSIELYGDVVRGTWDISDTGAIHAP